ncbi:palindromic element RPE2 domain-containing protein [Candidatus Tisiphia endosymbiont of Sialis lutaria]|uniref:palindromic element RPE2 domain-containing protein n=1 Tax=Candidatus Tisiphia endosymbiont of Sialis lutaria TaxID=2029164 RepID=UPI00312CBAC1
MDQPSISEEDSSSTVESYSQFRGGGTRNDGATPITDRRATSDDVTKSSSIDYRALFTKNIYYSC